MIACETPEDGGAAMLLWLCPGGGQSCNCRKVDPTTLFSITDNRSRRCIQGGFFTFDIPSAAMYKSVVLAKELVAASTEPMILSLLSKGENYGYELIQEVKRLSGNKIEWTDGMLYPVLHRMEDHGWIKSHWVEIENGRKRKYYSIKKDGHQALKEKREQWTVISSVLGRLWNEQHV